MGIAEPGTESSTVEELLEEARSEITRLTPGEAREAAAVGAILIDIRPGEQRRLEGPIPGAVVIPRNVLEWRLDPQGEHRDPRVARQNRLLILICREGYQSSLAAALLRRLGLQTADVIGGSIAWLEEKL
jgi:rhodanese-related sulfurtransferase